MQIYFLGARSKVAQKGQLYLHIIRLLQDLKHTVVYDHILQINKSQVSKSLAPFSNSDYHRQVRQKILNCDVVVAEVTVSTPAMAYEIALALENCIPVICLCQNQVVTKSIVHLCANNNPLIIYRSYFIENIKELIKVDLDYVLNVLKISDLHLLTPNIVKFVETKAKSLGISKNLYIRNLIQADMEH